MTQGTLETTDRLAGIHGLRAIAALTVVVFHVHGIHKLEMPDSFSLIKTHFGLGVQLFFVLSAFSLFFSTQSRVGKNQWVQDYFIRRFFRIAPLFYLMISVWYWVSNVDFNQKIPAYDVLLNFLFLFNLVPEKQDSIVWAGWTIGVEMLFYAILPVLLVYIRNIRGALVLLAVGVTVTTAARMAYDSSAQTLIQAYGHHSFLSQFGVFCAGIFSYFIYCRRHVYAWLRDHPIFYSSLSFSGILLIVLLIVLPTGPLILFGRIDILIWALAFALLAAGQAVRPWPILANRYLYFAGERSFSLYLLHPWIIYKLGPVYLKIYSVLGAYIGIAFIGCVLATLMVLIPASALSYRLIELPGMNLGRRLIKRTGNLPAKARSLADPVSPAKPDIV